MGRSPTDHWKPVRLVPTNGALPLGALSALLLLSGATLVGAENAAETQRRLETGKQQLQKVETRAKSLEKDLADISTEREKLNERLLETGALIQKSEARLTAIEARLGELDAQERLLRGSLDQRHGQISKLLSALMRMGRNPPPVMITRREDALKMVRSAMLLAHAFPELKGQAVTLATRLNELVRVMTDIRSEGDRLKAETQRLGEARTRLSALLETKKRSLDERQAELAQVRAAAADISKSVSDLNELITKLDKAVTEKTGLGDYEQQIKRDEQKAAAVATAAAAAQAESRPTAVMAGAPASDAVAQTPKPAGDKETKVAALTVPKPSEVIELAPKAGSRSLGKPDRIAPAIAFHLAKARLPHPAQGRRVLAFGEKTQYGSASKGIVLETRFNAQITSPCDGWVVYAGEFRSYGKLLIINAGGGYHVLLAGLSQIDVQPGQFVLASEPVGTMNGEVAKITEAKAQDAKSTEKAHDSAPVLYIEFRKDGRPIDPDPWWVDGHQKVQG